MLNQGCSNSAPENAAGEGACFAHGKVSRSIKKAKIPAKEQIAAASLFRLVSDHAKGSGNLPSSACRQLARRKIAQQVSTCPWVAKTCYVNM